MTAFQASIVRQIRSDENFKIGLEEGLEKGETKKSIEAVRSMTRKGFLVDVIADLLDLPEKFVLEIQGQLHSEPQILQALKLGKSRPELIAKRLAVHPLLVQVLAESQN